MGTSNDPAQLTGETISKRPLKTMNHQNNRNTRGEERNQTFGLFSPPAARSALPGRENHLLTEPTAPSLAWTFWTKRSIILCLHYYSLECVTCKLAMLQLLRRVLLTRAREMLCWLLHVKYGLLCPLRLPVTQNGIQTLFTKGPGIHRTSLRITSGHIRRWWTLTEHWAAKL